jgi:hypothetical protein
MRGFEAQIVAHPEGVSPSAPNSTRKKVARLGLYALSGLSTPAGR